MKKEDKDDKMMKEMTTEIQEFIREQLTKIDRKTDEPLILAGCLAAQVRHLYVALCGEETTLQVYRTMLEGLRQDVLKKGGSAIDETPTIH